MYVQFTSCVKGDDSKFLMWIGVLQWLLTLPTPSFWHDEPLLQGKQIMILVISSSFDFCKSFSLLCFERYLVFVGTTLFS